jgi:hypothetical protein
MTLQIWLVISAIIGLLIGLTSIFAPQSMLKPFGLRLEGKASVHFARSPALASYLWRSSTW